MKYVIVFIFMFIVSLVVWIFGYDPSYSNYGFYLSDSIFIQVDHVPAYLAGLCVGIFILFVFDFLKFDRNTVMNILLIFSLALIPSIILQDIISRYDYLTTSLMYLGLGVIYSVIMGIFTKQKIT